MSMSSRINPTEIIDVDALPEWNHSRRPPIVRTNRTSTPQFKSKAKMTIDLTNMDDSDSDFSILSSTTKSSWGKPSSGKEKEKSTIRHAIEKIRKRDRLTSASSSSEQSHSQAPAPKKLKLLTPPSASRDQSPNGIKLADGINSSNNEPIASTSTISMLSSSDFSKLSQGILPQGELRKIAQNLMSPHLSSSSRYTAAASSSSSRGQAKRKRTIVELSSDGEEVTESKKKKQTAVSSSSSSCELIAGPSTVTNVQNSNLELDLDTDIESGEDSDYDYIHAGYDIHDPDIWTPIPINPNRLQDEDEDEATNSMKRLTISKPEKYARPRYVDISIWHSPRIRYSGPPIFSWNQLRLATDLRYPTRPRPTPLLPLNKPFGRSWDLDFNLHRLKPVHFFKESPGSINRVEQKGEWTVIASACIGGLPDTEGEELSPYNRPGSLITWRNHLKNIPDGHQIKKGNHMKYYAVHDLKFFPHRMSFVSSGADGTIRIWNLDDEDDDQPNAWFNQRLHTFHTTPHDLAFKPDTSILAIAEKKIHIFSFRDVQFEMLADFPFHPPKSPHVIGSLAWGAESTADQLFGSSEPCISTMFSGTHKALDITTKKSLYQFDASEAGDTLSLDSTGATLALSTRAPEGKYLLRIYDTRRRLPTAIQLIELEPFHDDFEGEVNNASFSPDGMFLALARNDNHTHVYDRRMWDRGVIFDYDHHGESKAASQNDAYGVVKAQWIQSQDTRRMALITGGEDGCVRMWDPSMSAQNPKNGKILAEVNSDIGHFSLGDPFAGENQLVVGDNNGEVTIFNNVVI